jgi:MFS family permease
MYVSNHLHVLLSDPRQSTVQRLISSLLTLGSFVSSLSAGYFAGFFGRRQGLWVACALNAIACGIQIGTDSAGVLYLGRVLLGFANGFLVTFSNVYTSEVAPAHLRGVMTALFAYWVQIGSILGSVVVNSTKNRMDKLSYRIPIACLYIVPTILGIGLFFVPESPRWLLHKGRNEQARKSLEQLRRGAVTSDELELEWLEMNKGVEEELKLAKSLPFMDMFRGIFSPAFGL